MHHRSERNSLGFAIYVLIKMGSPAEATCSKGDQRLIEFSINPVTHRSPDVTCLKCANKALLQKINQYVDGAAEATIEEYLTEAKSVQRMAIPMMLTLFLYRALFQ